MKKLLSHAGELGAFFFKSIVVICGGDNYEKSSKEGYCLSINMLYFMHIIRFSGCTSCTQDDSDR